MRTTAEAFNEWMRRYVEEPEQYEHEITTVRRFLAEEADGTEPTYGEECAAYLAIETTGGPVYQVVCATCHRRTLREEAARNAAAEKAAELAPMASSEPPLQRPPSPESVDQGTLVS